jgi:glutamate racemase
MAAKGGAVGFFDSGLGGLCILAAFKTLCPHESTIYIADSKNCPYGNKPAAEIVKLAESNTRRLLRRGCKMVVVACNTATAAAIDFLRERHPEVPFIGIEPAVKPAALRSKTGVVGVLATAGTFGGRLYNETKAKFAKDVTVIATVADEFVDIVESLRVNVGSVRVGSDPNLTLNDPKVVAVVRARIEPLLKAGCDKIVLGCTHFPHLKPLIEKICDGRAEVIDPSDAVARQARRVLSARGLAAAASTKPSHIFIRT